MARWIASLTWFSQIKSQSSVDTWFSHDFPIYFPIDFPMIFRTSCSPRRFAVRERRDRTQPEVLHFFSPLRASRLRIDAWRCSSPMKEPGIHRYFFNRTMGEDLGSNSPIFGSGDPQCYGWFIRENPWKILPTWMIWGDPYFRKLSVEGCWEEWGSPILDVPPFLPWTYL